MASNWLGSWSMRYEPSWSMAEAQRVSSNMRPSMLYGYLMSVERVVVKSLPPTLSLIQSFIKSALSVERRL